MADQPGDELDGEPDLRPEAILQSLNSSVGEDGSGYLEWAENNPEAEYIISILGTPEEKNLRADAERRLRNVSRFVLITKVEAGLMGAIAISSSGLGVGNIVGWESGIVKPGIPGTLFLTIASIAAWWNTRNIISNDLPNAAAAERQQRALYQKYFGPELS